MNADLRPATVPSRTAAEPLYFSGAAGPLFGWLHSPTDGYRADLGIVLCKPFGYEALCGHRSLRAFAQMAAASGIPILNFDYAGTGDSADIDGNAEQIEIWCGDILSAVAELRRRTGVQRVCLLGFRLGALLAILAARRLPIDALILVAPVISGKAYLRDLRVTQSMAARRSEPDSSRQGWRRIVEAADGSMEVGGYRLCAATLARLGEADLDAPHTPPAPALLVVDRSGLPAARSWVQAISGPGVQVDYLAVPGFVDMMMTPPPFTRIPHTMIDCVREWLQPLSSAARKPFAAARVTPPGGVAVPVVDQLAARERPLGELPVRLGPDGVLFGILTEPAGPEPPRQAVVLVNAGADSHVCIGRIYVALARRWARNGCVVLRMDLAGLGDSDTRPGRPENEVYPPAAMDDLRAAIEFLRARYHIGDVTLAGLCSGAYHVLRAASAALPASRVVMVNPETFFWREGALLEDVQAAEVVRAPEVYRQRSGSLGRWKKLLTGHADVRRIVKVTLLRLFLQLECQARDTLRHLHLRLPNDLGWQLRQVAARGVDMIFVFARGEPGLELLKMQSGTDLKRLGGRCRIHIIEGADHTFSRSASRHELERVLSDALFAAPAINDAAG